MLKCKLFIRCITYTVAFVICVSCSIFNFEKGSVELSPSEQDGIYPLGAPLRAHFSFDPEHESAQNAVKLESDGKSVSADFTWDDRTLIITPHPPLASASRTNFGVSGVVKATDKSEYNLDEKVAFYTEYKNKNLLLTKQNIADAATIAVHDNLQFTFSEAISESDFRAAFSLSPSTDFNAVLSDEGRTVTVSPKVMWSNANYYTWTIKKTFPSVTGLILNEEKSGGFLVQSDIELPQIMSINPAMLSTDTQYTITSLEGLSLDNLQSGNAISFKFNKEINIDSLATALSITPSLQGHFIKYGTNEYAYLLTESITANTNYLLSISTDLSDLSGNKLAQSYTVNFAPHLVTQSLVSASLDSAGQNKTISDFSTGSNTNISFPTLGGPLTITLTFKNALTSAEQADFLSRITCSLFFPTDSLVSSPDLRSARWLSTKQLLLIYDGFTNKDAVNNIQYFYKLAISDLAPSDASRGGDTWFIFGQE